MLSDELRPVQGAKDVWIWLTSVAIVIPHLYLSEERTLYGDTVCFQFHTSEKTRVGFFWGYAVPCFLLLYLAPLAMMSVTYWKAGRKLAAMEKRLEVSSQCDLSVVVRTRKEVLRMLFVVVVMFVVQWTPFEIVEILATAPDLMDVDPISSLRVAVNMLAFSNAVFNPVVYGFMSKPFREGFKAAWLYFVCFRCCRTEQGQCICLMGSIRPLSWAFKWKKNAGSSTELSKATSSVEIDFCEAQ